MPARLRLRSCAWTLGAVAILAAAACSSSNGSVESGSITASGTQSEIDTPTSPPEPSTSVSAEVPGGAPAEFVSMWGHERGDESNDALLEGTLVIEAPCVYVVANIGLDEAGGEPPYKRNLLQLPRSGARFDAETGELWVWDNGPFVTGDRAGAGGGGGLPAGDAAECDFDGVWAATDLTLIPQPSFEELLASRDKAHVRAALDMWNSLNIEDVLWGYHPKSVTEIAGESTLVVIGWVQFIDFAPIRVSLQERATVDARGPGGHRYANLGVSVARVVAGEFRHRAADLISVSVWRDGITPDETYVIPGKNRPALLFLKAKDAYLADLGIDPSVVDPGFDADTASKIVAARDVGYYLTSARGVLISTLDGLLNPLLALQPDTDEPVSPVQQDGNTMSLRELEQVIHGALPPSAGADGNADAVSYVPSPKFEAMLYEYEYGPLADGAIPLEGTLVLEQPCAFLLETQPGHTGSEAPQQRHLLRLPRGGTRYAADTGELWVWDQGPFVAGDQVRALGGKQAEGADAAACSFDSVWGASHVTPPEDLP